MGTEIAWRTQLTHCLAVFTKILPILHEFHELGCVITILAYQLHSSTIKGTGRYGRGLQKVFMEMVCEHGLHTPQCATQGDGGSWNCSLHSKTDSYVLHTDAVLRLRMLTAQHEQHPRFNH